MGKRELLLIAAFVIVGTIVYQVTAPPPAPGERSFSLGQLIENIRRDVRGQRASAEVDDHEHAPRRRRRHRAASSTLPRTGELTITGEDRTDIDVRAPRPRPTASTRPRRSGWPRQPSLKIDDAGARARRSRSTYPTPRRHSSARIVLHVPARLQRPLEPQRRAGSRSSRVAASISQCARRKPTSSDIAGRVSRHLPRRRARDRRRRVAEAHDARQPTSQLERVRGETSHEHATAASCRCSELAGPIDIDHATAADIDAREARQDHRHRSDQRSRRHGVGEGPADRGAHRRPRRRGRRRRSSAPRRWPSTAKAASRSRSRRRPAATSSTPSPADGDHHRCRPDTLEVATSEPGAPRDRTDQRRRPDDHASRATRRHRRCDRAESAAIDALRLRSELSSIERCDFSRIDNPQSAICNHQVDSLSCRKLSVFREVTRALHCAPARNIARRSDAPSPRQGARRLRVRCIRRPRC